MDEMAPVYNMSEALQDHNDEDPGNEIWVVGSDLAPVRPEAPQQVSVDDRDQDSDFSAQILQGVQNLRDAVDNNEVLSSLDEETTHFIHDEQPLDHLDVVFDPRDSLEINFNYQDPRFGNRVVWADDVEIIFV